MLKTIRPPVPNAWHRGTQVFNLGRWLRLFFRHGLLGQARAGEGRLGRQAMELQPAILHGGLHAIAQLQAAGDDLLAQRVLHLALDGAAQRAGAVGGIGQRVGAMLQLGGDVRVDDKDLTLADSAVQAAVDECTAELGDSGRVLLRKSGTEPVLRVMAEAGTAEECEKQVDRIIAAMEKSGHLIEVKK